MKDKFIASVLLIVMTITLFSGCELINNFINQPAEQAAPVVAYDGSAVTISFYHTMNSARLQPVLDKYIQEFNKLYPNITVTHQKVGGYDDLYVHIQDEISNGKHPNLAYCYPEHVATYNDLNAVYSLNEFINSTFEVTDASGNTSIMGLTSEQIADFVPGFYAEGAVYDLEGTMYTLPFSKSTEMLYYNKTFFDEHGLKAPTTWDELEQLCAAIKAIDPNCIPFSYDNESNWFINMCMQYGDNLYTSFDLENHFLFYNDITRQFVERFKRWYDLGYFTTAQLYGNYTSDIFTNVNPDENGAVYRSYMIIGSSAGANYQQPPVDGNGSYYFETEMAMIPQVDPDNPKVVSQGPSLCIFKDSDPQEVAASWLFAKFLSTNIGLQAEFSAVSGYAPVIQSVLDFEPYKEWLESANGFTNLAAKSASLALANVDAYYRPYAFTGCDDARYQVGYIMLNVFSSSRTDLDALIDEEFKRAIDFCKKNK